MLESDDNYENEVIAVGAEAVLEKLEEELKEEVTYYGANKHLGALPDMIEEIEEAKADIREISTTTDKEIAYIKVSYHAALINQALDSPMVDVLRRTDY